MAKVEEKIKNTLIPEKILENAAQEYQRLLTKKEELNKNNFNLKLKLFEVDQTEASVQELIKEFQYQNKLLNKEIEQLSIQNTRLTQEIANKENLPVKPLSA